MLSHQYKPATINHKAVPSRDQSPPPLHDQRNNIVRKVIYDGRADNLQLKSKVTNTGQYYSWGLNQTLVGKKMEAYLDPHDPLQGQSASLNTHQDPMMNWIKKHNKLNASWAVKGHLLNDNLGGTAMNVNLFPITKAANAVHLRVAENLVKNRLWDEQNPTYYYVEASIGSNGNDQLYAAIYDWNMSNGSKSLINSGYINSDMGCSKDMDMANADDLDYVKSTYTAGKAASVGRAYLPHKNVGDLNQNWKNLRDQSGTKADLSY